MSTAGPDSASLRRSGAFLPGDLVTPRRDAAQVRRTAWAQRRLDAFGFGLRSDVFEFVPGSVGLVLGEESVLTASGLEPEALVLCPTGAVGWVRSRAFERVER